jgi:hypothetical protein
VHTWTLVSCCDSAVRVQPQSIEIGCVVLGTWHRGPARQRGWWCSRQERCCTRETTRQICKQRYSDCCIWLSRRMDPWAKQQIASGPSRPRLMSHGAELVILAWHKDRRCVQSGRPIVYAGAFHVLVECQYHNEQSRTYQIHGLIRYILVDDRLKISKMMVFFTSRSTATLIHVSSLI